MISEKTAKTRVEIYKYFNEFRFLFFDFDQSFARRDTVVLVRTDLKVMNTLMSTKIDFNQVIRKTNHFERRGPKKILPWI